MRIAADMCSKKYTKMINKQLAHASELHNTVYVGLKTDLDSRKSRQRKKNPKKIS